MNQPPGTPSAPRDRDPQGRPRNARPRDASGRPLPRGTDGVAEEPEVGGRSTSEALARAQQLVEEGRPFAAHEVLETRWKEEGDPQLRPLWRGLAQLMVGLTHLQRGNRRGAERLLRRGGQTLRELADSRDKARSVDRAAWVAWADGAADAVRDDHPVAPPPSLQQH